MPKGVALLLSCVWDEHLALSACTNCLNFTQEVHFTTMVGVVHTHDLWRVNLAHILYVMQKSVPSKFKEIFSTDNGGNCLREIDG